MFRLKRIIISAVAFCLPVVAMGQHDSPEPTKQEYRRQFYSDYSRWTVGANMGFSFVWGDFKSFGADKNYWGGTWGVHSTYQFTPTVGIGLDVAFNLNKAGAKYSNREFYLQPDGFTYHGGNPPELSARYDELYSRIRSWSIGLNAEINVNNLFKGTSFASQRKFTVVVSPGIYLIRFKPGVYWKESGEKFNTTDLHYDWSFGLGGDASLQYKVSRIADLQFKSSVIWVTDNKFDGVYSATNRKLNGLVKTQIGVVFKLGTGKKKKDHLMYAPVRKYVYPVAEKPAPEIKIEKDTVFLEKVVERIVEVEIEAQTPFPYLPTIHFERGSMEIDRVKFSRELREIVSVLTANENAKVRIRGYADHTGGEQINDTISFGRAEAMRNYLIEHGIDHSRIVDIQGMGKDTKLTGEKAFSEDARRVEILKEK